MTPLSDAQRKLVAELAPLAERLARRYARAGRPASELLGPAHEALIEAVSRHDPAKGPLEPWAVLRVRGAVLDTLRGQARRQRRELLLLGAAFAAGEPVGVEAPPTTESIAAFFDAPSPREQALSELRARLADCVVRVAAQPPPSEPDPETELADRQLFARRAAAVRRELERLGEPDREVAQAIYFDEQPTQQIAARLGVSERHVRRIHERVRDRLATRLKAELQGAR